ncbi:MAG TPA: DUF2157 domain-containing protein [Vicinamibacterales bacterium]
MKILHDLERWTSAGAITGAQHDAIAELVRKDRFSVFVELNTLLYLGVLAFIGGVGWTIQTHFASLGDAAILSALTLTFCFCLYYCFSRALPYSSAQVESSGFAFDYVLYLGCLVLALEFGYLESQFHILQDGWDNYLLISAFVFFVLAYRFDNRFVLSLALSTLAGWFSLRLTHFPDVGGPSVRTSGLVYGGLVAVAGTGLYKAGVKKHFLETYLHVAGNVLFIALLSGVASDEYGPYLLGLLGLSVTAIALGVRFKRFAFVVYGIGYGYIGVSIRLLREINSFTAGLAYVAVSSTAVIVTLAAIARRFGREE